MVCNYPPSTTLQRWTQVTLASKEKNLDQAKISKDQEFLQNILPQNSQDTNGEFLVVVQKKKETNPEDKGIYEINHWANFLQAPVP